ncbi:MAG: sodium:proton antiporter [Solirubrobacterales bacterium]|nr:sodium:proton antiporter [Solirubrobacterales bacterium]
MAEIGIIAAVLFAYSLVSDKLSGWAITPPMVFVAAGVLLGPDVLGVFDLTLTGETGLALAEIALVIVLFADAARIDLRALSGNRNLPVRLLGIGMPLTIILGVLIGAVLLKEVEFWEAAIVAAILAPTDAALGQAVVSSQKVPQRIRQALNVESGLNDGLSIPFLFLFVGLAVTETVVTATGWATFVIEQIGIGAGVGLATGLAGGFLFERATDRDLVSTPFQQLGLVGLAVGSWALADFLGGNGFIAAFTAGLAAGRITPHTGQRILAFTEDEGQLLNLIIFFVFGASAITLLDGLTWHVIVYGLLSLTLIRMVPVAISTIGTGLKRSSVLFMGWFGPRGLASIILALVVIEEEPELPALATVLAAMTFTVLVSVFAHGLTAEPLINLYSRVIRSDGAAAESEEAMELQIRK